MPAITPLAQLPDSTRATHWQRLAVRVGCSQPRGVAHRIVGTRPSQALRPATRASAVGPRAVVGLRHAHNPIR